MRWWRISLVLLSAATGVAGQQPPAAEPRFWTSTQAVLLDVTVRDRSGAHVRDLTIDDFEVLEDGRRCALLSLEAVPRDAADTGSELNPGVPRAACADCAAPDEQTVIAVVFHQLTHQSRAEAVKAVRNTLPALRGSEFIGVFTIDSSLVEHAAFTRDRGVIDRALAQVLVRPPVTGPSGSSLMEQSGFPGAGGASASESAAAGMRARLDADPGYASRREVVDSRSLVNLVDGMAQYAGRRVVLLLSEGLYISPRLTSAGRAAIRQNVSIYAIGAGGFTGDANAQSDMTAWADFTSASRFDPDLRLQYHESDGTKGLGPIAWWTGGLRLAGTNDLGASIRRAAEDWRPYYLLAYQAPAGDTAASPRIEVRVKRPALAVRARQIRGK